MKYIITEDQLIRNAKRRVLSSVDDYFDNTLEHYFHLGKLCKSYPTADGFYDDVIKSCLEVIYWNYEYWESNGPEWKTIEKMISDYIESDYKDHIYQYYKSKCN